MKQQPVPIHTEYIQIDQLLKLEGVIETGGQVKGLIDDQVLTWHHRYRKTQKMSRWRCDWCRRPRCGIHRYQRGGIIGEN